MAEKKKNVSKRFGFQRGFTHNVLHILWEIGAKQQSIVLEHFRNGHM